MTTSLPEFGYTRWGLDIVRHAEPLDTRTPNAQAPRARSIARNNGVALTLDGRVVRALVQRGGQASVAHLEFAPMPHATAATLGTLLGTTTILDDDIHQRATAGGFEVGTRLDNCDCSCSARTERCVHILAALYALAAHVDADPHAALTLQGYGSDDVAESEDAEVRAPHWIPLSAVDVSGFFG